MNSGILKKTNSTSQRLLSGLIIVFASVQWFITDHNRRYPAIVIIIVHILFALYEYGHLLVIWHVQSPITTIQCAISIHSKTWIDGPNQSRLWRKLSLGDVLWIPRDWLPKYAALILKHCLTDTHPHTKLSMSMVSL